MTSYFPVVIHHNPECGASRNVLAMIRAAGYAPTIVEYLQTGWTRPQLLALFAAAGLTAREALRVTKSPAEALGLTAAGVADVERPDARIVTSTLSNLPTDLADEHRGAPLLIVIGAVCAGLIKRQVQIAAAPLQDLLAC